MHWAERPAQAQPRGLCHDLGLGPGLFHDHGLEFV